MSQGGRAECRRGLVRRWGRETWWGPKWAERRESRGELGEEMGPSGKEALSWG